MDPPDWDSSPAFPPEHENNVGVPRSSIKIHYDDNFQNTNYPSFRIGS
jgi:hypothetical protein